MIIQQAGYPLTVSDQLILILNKEIELHSEVDMSLGCVINFRDPDFSAERGGYHPVEISLNKLGHVQTITNFAYVSNGHHAELAKELDFDLANGLFQHRGRDFPISECAELFETWQGNFCAYYLFKAFNITIHGYS